MNGRKLVCAMLTCVLLFVYVSPASVLAQEEALSLEQAIQEALASHADLRDASQALIQANAGLNSAFSALLNVIEKDLFFPMVRQRSITRDVELALKPAEAQKELYLAEEEMKAIERQIRAEVEKQYISTYQSKQNVLLSEQRLQDRRTALREWQLKARFGRGNEEQLSKAETDVKEAESELKQARLAHNRDKVELGKLLGRNVEELDLQLHVDRYYVPLTQAAMWGFVQHAMREDLELIKATEEMKMAESKVAAVRSSMNANFTPLMTGAVEGMFNSNASQYTTGEINYDELIANIEVVLGSVEVFWYGIILIPLPIMPYILPLPLKLIQGDFDGTRYLDDERLILLDSMMDLDSARHNLQDMQNELIIRIKASYLSAKQAEEAYVQALGKEELAQKAVRNAELIRRFGSMKDEEWELLQRRLEEANQAAFDAYVAYRDALAALDADAAGGVMPRRIEGVLPWDSLEEDGTEPLVQQPEEMLPPKGDWFIEPTVQNMKSKFSIDFDGADIGAETYSLQTRRGYEIGERQPLDGEVEHLQFVFGNIKDLRVVFYNGSDTVVAEARLDGYGQKGSLDVRLIR